MAPEVAAAEAPKQLTGLPVLVIGPVDIGRLSRELAMIDEALLQLGLRKGGTEIKMPKTSQLLDKVIELNKLNLLQQTDRQILQEFLAMIDKQAPVIHISFSADPPVAFLEKLMAWLRHEIHPLLLVRIGLQPTIGAGCVVRTINQQFDFSLKKDFSTKRDLLKQALKMDSAPAPEPAPEVVAA
ncbi:MAG TPA: hypothetical protein VN778_00820 [Verrucomicrobiae bacterium]|nr:hypothetical protein [Verrucomicrobiae bacterium]